MARIFEGPGGTENNHSDQKIIFSADGQDKIDLPGGEFVADAQMTRDGQDLVLTAPGGESVVVEGYFMADPAPILSGPEGASLSPELVNSFLTASPHHAAAGGMTDESPVGAVEELQGKATVTHADGTTETLNIGSPIYEGDIIETGAEGAVNVLFADETSMAVSAGARMAVDEYSFDPATESGTTNFSVLRGVFVFTSGLIGRDDPDDVQIDTPVGSIGIRGTIIAGNIQPDGESEITVVEGAIVVKNGTMETTLSMQYETIKLAGFDSVMHSQGVLDAKTVGTTYGSVSGVAPTLFSAVNDTAAEQSGDNKTPETGNAASDEAVGAPAEDGNGEAAPEEIAPETMQLNQTTDPFTADPFTAEGTREAETTTTTTTLTNKLSGTKPPPTANIKTVLTGEPDHTQTQTQTDPRVSTATTTNTGDGSTGSGNNTPTGPLNINSAGAGSGVSRIGDNIGNKIGHSVTALGDVNHDGFADFMFTNNTTNSSQNHTYLVYGSAGGIPSGTITSLTGTVSVQALANPYGGNVSGAIVAGIGDFDGDGTNDYIVGQSQNDTTNFGSGNAFIVSGANPASGYISMEGAQTGNNLGKSVAGIGDFNNDGYDDVLIGATGAGGGVQGASYILWGGASAYGTPVDISALTGQGAVINGVTANDGFGKAMAGIGDFDGDGYSDIAIGASMVDAPSGTDAGRVYLYDGNNPTTAYLQISGAGAGHQLGNDIFALGDINGDGKSDLMIGAENANPNNGMYEAYVVYGGAGSSVNVGSIGTAGFAISTPQQILGGGAAGDFNGDGYDDFAIALQNGTNADIYVVYGSNGNGALVGMDRAYSLADLNNPDYAFKMTYTGGGSLDFSITSGGDVNGDGYDDLVLGAENANGTNGEILVVNGRAVGADYVTNGTATANGQHLVGTANMADGGNTGVSMAGTHADNAMTITNTNFLNIDGGLGNDTLRVGGIGNTLDFTNVNYEKMSGIEKLAFTESGQTVTLTVENIFNLLKSSDGGELHIGLDGVGSGTLMIDAAGPTGASINDRIVNAMNEMGAGATYDGSASAGAYEVFNIGGYTLYIDDAIMTNTTVV